MNLQKVKLGLVALILGFGLVITQSAFTPKFAPATHFNTAATGMPANWVPLDDKVIGNEEGEYSCNEEDNTRACIASLSGGVYTVEDYGILEQN